MAFSHSHKTVFVMDRSPYFLESSHQSVDIDMFSKIKQPGLIPLAPITKSMWTCNVEAVLEYMRIVYDIFPNDKLIQIVVSDVADHCLNTGWSEGEQNIQQIMNRLAELPPVSLKANPGDCNIIRGLSKAVELLTQPSRVQQMTRMARAEDGSSPLINRGRIICLSAFNGENAVNRVEERMQEVVTQWNDVAAENDTLLSVDRCQLVLVDLVTFNQPRNNVLSRPQRQLSSCLSSEVFLSQSGRSIAVRLVDLVVSHFDLSSTTITGIPMKEEQNASSSANYDVELLHSSMAHLELIKSGQSEGLMMPSKEGLFAPTVMLKWCTPKTTSVELQQCTGAYRITPVDVISRPSSCLTNFLLNGRSVMLEQPRKTSTKLISHMLTSHAGEIYLHVLATSRSPLEDPPSISEGAGGRLTDYRINDFGEFMKENRLVPFTTATGSSGVSSLHPLIKAKAQLERMTRLWPLVISDTIIFNMTAILQPLPSLIVKQSLTDAEVMECRKAIFHVVGLESRNEPLPNAAAGVRGKSGKRDDQYRMMWNELERFVRAHSSTSPRHAEILNCLLECKRPSEDSRGAGTRTSSEDSRLMGNGRISDVKKEVIDSVLSSAQAGDMTMKGVEKQELLLKRVATSDSLLGSSATTAKRFKPGGEMGGGGVGGSGQSVLSVWRNRITEQHRKRCVEFSGRQNLGSGTKVELYTHLNKDLPNSSGLKFSHELKIQGVIGVSVDDEVFIVHMNERFGGDDNCDDLSSVATGASRKVKEAHYDELPNNGLNGHNSLHRTDDALYRGSVGEVISAARSRQMFTAHCSSDPKNLKRLGLRVIGVEQSSHSFEEIEDTQINCAAVNSNQSTDRAIYSHSEVVPFLKPETNLAVSDSVSHSVNNNTANVTDVLVKPDPCDDDEVVDCDLEYCGGGDEYNVNEEEDDSGATAYEGMSSSTGSLHSRYVDCQEMHSSNDQKSLSWLRHHSESSSGRDSFDVWTSDTNRPECVRYKFNNTLHDEMGLHPAHVFKKRHLTPVFTQNRRKPILKGGIWQNKSLPLSSTSTSSTNLKGKLTSCSSTVLQGKSQWKTLLLTNIGCQLCGQSFTQKPNLLRHQRLVHGRETLKRGRPPTVWMANVGETQKHV